MWLGTLLSRVQPEQVVMQTYVGADPAANAETSITVPGGRAWVIVSYLATLVADANAANRFPSLVITDGVRRVMRIASGTATTANQTIEHCWAVVGQSRSQTAGALLEMLPADLLLLPGWTIGSLTQGLQATDNWGAPTVLVTEFDYPLR